MTSHLVMAGAYSAKKDVGNARKAGIQVLTAEPAFSLKDFSKQQPYRKPHDLEVFTAQLSTAGLLK